MKGKEVLTAFLVGVATKFVSDMLIDEASFAVNMKVETSTCTTLLILILLTVVAMVAFLAYMKARNMGKMIDSLGLQHSAMAKKSKKHKKELRNTHDERGHRNGTKVATIRKIQRPNSKLFDKRQGKYARKT